MEISMFSGPIILVILGVIIRFGKAGFLISGYNTSSKDEKGKYDEAALCKFIGNLLFILAGVFLITIRGIGLKSTYIVAFGSVTIFTVIIAAIIYMNTGNRFKKQ